MPSYGLDIRRFLAGGDKGPPPTTQVTISEAASLLRAQMDATLSQLPRVQRDRSAATEPGEDSDGVAEPLFAHSYHARQRVRGCRSAEAAERRSAEAVQGVHDRAGGDEGDTNPLVVAAAVGTVATYPHGWNG